MSLTYRWVRNYLIWILCKCFTGTVLWVVSRELLSSHSISQGLVLQPVGRASVVVGTDQTTATVALPARALQVHRKSDEIGSHYIVLKDQWKQRHWHRGLWDPKNIKNKWGWWKKQRCPCEKGRVGWRESHFEAMPHEDPGHGTFSGWGTTKVMVKLCKEYMLQTWRDFWLVT